jgi:Tfp pilus assembly PilM family ATPase/Tfp pilus assembly protein PilN
MLGKKKHTVGLYIGSQKTVLARLQRVGTNHFMVEHLSVADTPPDTYDEEAVVSVSSLSKLIRDLMDESDVRAQEVSLAVAVKQGVIIRTLTLPSMSKKEIKEALGSEVENYAPLSSDEPILDFQITGQTFEGAAQKLEIFLSAAPKSLIRSYMASVEAASLRASSIEPLPLAILRTLAPVNDELSNGNGGTSKIDDETSTMAVCLEENDGLVIISRGNTIRFIHSIEFGRSHLDNARVFGELAGEIRSSLAYYQTTYPEFDVDKILLYVDSEDIETICARLSEFLDVPVTSPPLPETSDEFTKSALEKNVLSAYAAIGTAMFTRGDEVINLVPPKGIGAINIKKQAFVGALSVMLAILLSIGISFGLKAWTRAVNQNTESVIKSRESYKEGYAALSGAQSEVIQLRTQIDMAKRTLQTVSTVKWIEVLPELSAIIPKNIWLSGLSWQEGSNAVLVGQSLSYDSVFRFIDTLNDSPYFKNPQLTFVRRVMVGELSYMQFEIKCGLKVDKLGGQEVNVGIS